MNSANVASVPFYLPKTPASDINGIDWMAQQNGGQFDPVLFGDYRDPQDSILQNNFNDFFSDAFPISDLSSPFSNGDTAPPAPKRDIIKEIEEQQSGTYDGVGPANPRQYVTCDKLWLVLSSHLCLQFWLTFPFSVQQGPCTKLGESAIWRNRHG